MARFQMLEVKPICCRTVGKPADLSILLEQRQCFEASGGCRERQAKAEASHGNAY